MDPCCSSCSGTLRHRCGVCPGGSACEQAAWTARTVHKNIYWRGCHTMNDLSRAKFLPGVQQPRGIVRRDGATPPVHGRFVPRLDAHTAAVFRWDSDRAQNDRARAVWRRHDAAPNIGPLRDSGWRRKSLCAHACRPSFTRPDVPSSVSAIEPTRVHGFSPRMHGSRAVAHES